MMLSPQVYPWVYFATDCGWIACSTARVLVLIGAVFLFVGVEWSGYRLTDRSFPHDARKRRVAFGYLTALNLLLVPTVAVLTYTVLP